MLRAMPNTHINIHLDSKFRSSQTKPNETNKKCIIILPLSPWFWCFMKPTIIIRWEHFYIHFLSIRGCGGKNALQFAHSNIRLGCGTTLLSVERLHSRRMEVGSLEPLLHPYSNASEVVPLQYPIVNPQTLAVWPLVIVCTPSLSCRPFIVWCTRHDSNHSLKN